MKTSLAVFLAALATGSFLAAQDTQSQQGSATVSRRPQPGTTTDSDSAAIPSKLSPKATKDADAGSDVNFKAESNVVDVDVQVIDQKGNPIPGLKRENFRILEDNVPQKMTQFSLGEAPMTVALVIEFSGRFQAYYTLGWAQTLNTVYGFVQSLHPDDYLAIVAYDLKSEILSDFTDDRGRTMAALSRLRIPGFSESNMFDAVADTADRMSKIEGRKAIVLISSGIDTFSKLTYDKTRKALQESGVPVYSIEMLQVQRAMSNMGPGQELDFLQGDNELRTFAKETGAQAFFPRFTGDLPGIFQQISQSLRTQYSLAYSSSNMARDGKFRKITVQLINPSTNEPLKMIENGKVIKYTILAKQGYTAPLPVE